LARHHVVNKEELVLIPAPPGTTSTSPLVLILAGSAIFASLVGLSYMIVRLLAKD